MLVLVSVPRSEEADGVVTETEPTDRTDRFSPRDFLFKASSSTSGSSPFNFRFLGFSRPAAGDFPKIQ